MAFSVPSRGRRAGARYRPLAEINVTPLVDVMLVLLIVFMVTAPLMTSGVTVDLPTADAKPLTADTEPVTVSLNAEGKIYLQNTETDLPALVPKLQEIAKNNAEQRIFVRGDKGLSYGRVMEVMGTITQGGFTKVALLADAPGAPANGANGGPATRPPAGRR